MAKREYKKILQGGLFKWYINPSDINDVSNTSESCLGLTRGANINIGDDELRNIEADGQLGMVKGGQRITDIQPSVQLTLLQWNKEIITSLKRFLIDETQTNIKTYRPKGILEEQDYIDKLVGIGKLVDGSFVRIILENAIVNQLPSFDLTDKDEVAYPITFMGTYDSADSKNVPIQISIIENSTNEQIGIQADEAIQSGKPFDYTMATATDEPTLKTEIETAVNKAIETKISTPIYNNGTFTLTLFEDAGSTFKEAIDETTAGEEFTFRYQLDTTGYSEQTYQTFGEITIKSV